jgi:hypothetical protein
MLNNFNGVWELASSTLLTKAEMKDMEADTEESGGVAREFKKAMISEYLGSAIDVDRLEELLKDARKKANKTKLEETNPAENMVDDQEKLEEEMM